MDYSGSSSLLTWQDAKVILRKHGATLGIVVAVCVFCALVYSIGATRQYTAYTRILIDTPRSPVVAGDGTNNNGGGGGLAVQEVESQMQVLMSDRIGYLVLNDLRKKDLISADKRQPTFVDRTIDGIFSGLRAVRNIFTGPPAVMDPDRAALEELLSRMVVRRLGTSYVLEVSYTSPSPQLAADVANAFARSYIQEEVDSRAMVWKRASSWLEERLNELRARSEEAARAAQDFKAQNGSNADTWPRARELERTAEAYDALYSAFLRRHTDSVQQETFPIPNSKVISEASKPVSASHPRTFLITAFAAFFGLVLGVSLALIRWSGDRTVRGPMQVAKFGVRCLATLPRLPKAVSNDSRNAIRTVLRAPRSQFTEALRMVHAEISMAERQRPIRFIGITSALPGEGKTTIAGNLAQLFAGSRQTLLIDADMRNPQMSIGLGDDGRDAVAVGDGLWLQPVHSVLGCPSLSFLGVNPASTGRHVSWHDDHSFETMLSYAATEYEKVIIDLPPAGGVAEARYIAPLLDAIIVVVESERTPEDAMIACIDACNVEQGKVFGVILNKAHASMLPESYGLAGNYFVPDSAVAYVEPRRPRKQV